MCSGGIMNLTPMRDNLQYRTLLCSKAVVRKGSQYKVTSHPNSPPNCNHSAFVHCVVVNTAPLFGFTWRIFQFKHEVHVSVLPVQRIVWVLCIIVPHGHPLLVAYLHQQLFSQFRSYVLPQRYYSVKFVYTQNIHRKIRQTQNASFVSDIFVCEILKELRTQKHVPLYLSVIIMGAC